MRLFSSLTRLLHCRSLQGLLLACAATATAADALDPQALARRPVVTWRTIPSIKL